MLWQNGRATLIVAVSSHDDHFHDEAHHDRLVELADRMEVLRDMVGARQKTFAGVLPGVLSSRGILTYLPEGDITAAMVAQAVRQVSHEATDEEPLPVIVLGAHGYIGRRLVDLLRQEMPVHPVDTALPDSPWPDHLHGRPALLVNVANRHALHQHLDRLWPGLTVLNEVYPEPDQAVLTALGQRGISVHHVAGVAGKAFPPFPDAYAAYAGAIPCCAAWPSDRAQASSGPFRGHHGPRPDRRIRGITQQGVVIRRSRLGPAVLHGCAASAPRGAARWPWQGSRRVTNPRGVPRLRLPRREQPRHRCPVEAACRSSLRNLGWPAGRSIDDRRSPHRQPMWFVGYVAGSCLVEALGCRSTHGAPPPQAMLPRPWICSASMAAGWLRSRSWR